MLLQARFVVMGNVFPTDVRLHRRYDLKGSTLGRTSARKSGDPNTVLKVQPPCLLVWTGTLPSTCTFLKSDNRAEASHISHKGSPPLPSSTPQMLVVLS